MKAKGFYRSRRVQLNELVTELLRVLKLPDDRDRKAVRRAMADAAILGMISERDWCVHHAKDAPDVQQRIISKSIHDVFGLRPDQRAQ